MTEEVEKLKKEIASLTLKLMRAKGYFLGETFEDLKKDPFEHLTEKQIKKIKGYLIPEKEEDL